MNRIKTWHQVSLLFIVTAVVLFFDLLYFPVISNDGVLYFSVAHIFLHHGLKAAMALYNWPFYSILLATLHRTLGLSLPHAAYLLNFVFLFFTLWLFVLIVDCVAKPHEKARSLFWYSLIVILAFHYFIVLSHLAVRDTGYYLFYLLSVFLLLNAVKKPSWTLALLWSFSIIMATLFRIEGAAFFLLLPFVSFLMPERSFGRRLYHWFQLYVLLIAAFLCALVYLLIHQHSNLQPFGKLNDLLVPLTDKSTGILSQLHLAIQGIKHQVLNPIYSGNAAIVLISGLLCSYLYSFINLVGLGAFILILYAWGHCLPAYRASSKRVLWSYVFVNVIVTLVFLFQHLFLTERYLVAAALTLLIFAPCGLQTFVKAYTNKTLSGPTRWIFYLVALLLTINIISIVVHLGPSKRYIYNATQWVKQNTPSNAVIYSNEGVLPFYADRKTIGWQCPHVPNPKLQLSAAVRAKCFDWNKLAARPWKGSDYLVLSMKNKRQAHAVMKVVQSAPVKIFVNNKKKMVYIFALK